MQLDMAARLALKKGIDQVADTIRITLGPKGRNVVLAERFQAPLVSNDGAAIAQRIVLEDPVENMGAALIKDACLRTNEAVGDGTTTAVVLAQAFVAEGMKCLEAGMNVVMLNKGIKLAVEKAMQEIAAKAQLVTSLEQIRQIAAASAESETLGVLLAEAFEQVGKDGIITVEGAQTLQDSLEILEGVTLEKGYISAQMINVPEKSAVVYENVAILIVDQAFHPAEEILPILEKAVEMKQPLLLIAAELKGEALRLVNMNNSKGIIQVAAIECPTFGENRYKELEDYAALTGGQAMTEHFSLAMSEMTAEMYGHADKVIISKKRCTLIGSHGNQERIAQRIAEIEAEQKAYSSEFTDKICQMRLSRLRGKAAILKLGAATESELKERKMRAEDAVLAVRAAWEEGITVGGGLAYVQASRALAELESDNPEIEAGIILTKKALCRPLWQIAENAGQNGQVVVETVKNLPEGMGYNVASGQYENMQEAGVMDAVKVCRASLRSAASVAEMILTAAVAVK